MKYVIDATVAEAWYVSNSHTAKAMRLRFDFLRSVHGLLVPDIFPADSAQTLVNAERKGVIPSGRAQIELHDMQFLGIPVLPSYPLLERASTIALATKLKVFASLYIALAEREQCQLITADQKLLRAVRRHFSFSSRSRRSPESPLEAQADFCVPLRLSGPLRRRSARDYPIRKA